MNIINGKVYNGNNVVVKNNRIWVDGIEVTEENEGKRIVIEIKGDLSSVKSDGDVIVHGNVHGDVDAGGTVECKDVHGNVDAGNSIHCGNVGGSVDAGNSIHCGEVRGNIKAGNGVYER